MNNKSNDLESSPIGRLLCSLALPAIAAQLVNMLYNIVDRIYIGHIPGIGADALTGVGVTFPIVMLISAFAALICMGGAPRAAIFMGKRDVDFAEQIMGSCCAAVIAAALMLTVVFTAFGEPLLKAFGASPVTLPYGLQYLRIYVLGTIFVQLSLGLNAFITTQGFALFSMATVMIGAVVNIILDPVFIFLLDMGVSGAALASVISQGVSSCWVLRFLTGKRTVLRLKRKNLRLSSRVMAPVLALGISPFIMQSTESLLSIVFNRSLQSYGGDIAVGSMTILASVMQMVMLPMTGLSQGAQPIISYNFGACRFDRVKRTFKLLITVSLSFTTIMWALATNLPQLFVGFFTDDPQLFSAACRAMKIYMAASFIIGAQMSCQQTFVALGQAKVSLFLALLRKIILLIPLILILPHFFFDKVFAVFFAEPIADFTASCVTSAVFAFKFPKLIQNNMPYPPED